MVLPDFFLPMKDTTGSGLASMKARMRGWSAARQPPPPPASRLRGRLQLRRGVDVHEELLGIAVAAVVHVQVAGVEIGVDVEDAPAAGADEVPIGVERPLAVDGAQEAACSRRAGARTRRSPPTCRPAPTAAAGVTKGMSQARQSTRSVGDGQHRRVDAHRRPALGEGVVDHRQTQVVEPGGLRASPRRRAGRAGAVRSRIHSSRVPSRNGGEGLVLAHAGGVAAGQQGKAHVGAVGSARRGSFGVIGRMLSASVRLSRVSHRFFRTSTARFQHLQGGGLHARGHLRARLDAPARRPKPG